MEKTSSEIVFSIIIATVVVIILAVFILLFFLFFVSKKKKLFKEKILMQQQFQIELIKTQMEVQEKTRKHLAEELHDNIGQILSLTNVTLASVNFDDTAKAATKIADAQGLVALSIKELRQLSKIIHGEQLMQQGLPAAIEQEVSRLKRNGEYLVHFTNNIDKPIFTNPDKDLFMYRLLQECINNILKHAEADTIEIKLSQTEYGLLLELVDNGKGFNINDAKLQQGMGLQNMQKRTNLLNGKMKIASSEGRGTNITFTIPYP